MDYKEIIKKRLGELPSEWRSFVLDENWRSNVSNLSRQFRLSEAQAASLENEVFFVLLGLEPPEDFVLNLKREVSLDENVARKISDFVNGWVFIRVINELKEYWDKNTQNNGVIQNGQSLEPQKERQNNNVGDSFERTILNQAKAMRPAFGTNPATNPTKTSPLQGYDINKPSLSASLPLEKKSLVGPPDYRKASDYKAGSDPYREPVE